MNISSLLFALYLFTLGLFPCADRVECDDFAKQEAMQSSNHADHEHTSEMCSPFCACACCGIDLGFGQKISLVTEPVYYFSISDMRNFFYISHIPSSSLSEIWQPPKFVNV
ncbi:MAG: hypothetical protein EAZ67_10715 [Cytophagales bacterium]|nr:MAG: hypothetical protein EAZ67_10715 [Cytophagales bacterium]